jgi:4-hydroxythreonine-4-phosphate dehydrogenase
MTQARSTLASVAALPAALTMGEPAGIGGEIALKSWDDRRRTSCFFAIDDIHRLKSISSASGMNVPVEAIETPAAAMEVFDRALPVIHMPLNVPSRPGVLDEANAPAVCGAIERAVNLVREGKASAVVTNPIHKGCLYAAGFNYPGHTEYLAALAQSKTPPVMMLACSKLRVVPVTIHISLAQVLLDLNTESIRSTGVVTAQALKRDFGIEQPRLAVAGLNPHAGEDGAMGKEEIQIIAPAIASLRDAGIEVSGPYPPDTMFTPRARSTYDAALCMYHDQALIPLKTLDFDGGVNVTLGLPFVRTSPDHGTALDIAGTGRADPGSLIEAINLATDMARRRAALADG